MEMHEESKSVLLVSMPFADCSIPSIQLALLESYLKRCGVDVGSLHLYLKAVDFYGLKNYNFLSDGLNDAYTAQMVFSRYVFPDYWKEKKSEFHDFFKNSMSDKSDLFSFEEFVSLTDKFLDFVYERVDWKHFDVVGFTLNYGQMLPSLALSKRVKEKNSDMEIVFGGSTVLDQLGGVFLENFDWIDFVVYGEGEEALYKIAVDEECSSIPNVFYRKNKEVVRSSETSCVDLNDLPYPVFSSFYQNLSSCGSEVQQHFQLNGRIPIEFSRGCWWNKCSFCNLKVQHPGYREKNVDRFVDELSFLADKYKMLTFQVVANTLPLKDYKKLCNEIIKLGKDFDLYIEARAGRLNREDYRLLKKAGFNHIQTGVETFSSNYLKKINKGVKVIDNVAALKFCKENNIKNHYNLIVGYPNEEKIDFEQTRKNIELFKGYLDPPQVSHYITVYGSDIYKNPDIFNIKRIKNTKSDKLMFPKKILDDNPCFYYDFEKQEELADNDWEKLFEEWEQGYEKHNLDFIKNHKLIDKLVFYFIDGGHFLKIYDKRDGEQVNIFVLDRLEREIFLSCLDVISFDKLKERFPDIPEYKIAAILHSFEQNGIVFKEENRYLSLPLQYSSIEKQELESSKIQQKEEITGF